MRRFTRSIAQLALRASQAQAPGASLALRAAPAAAAALHRPSSALFYRPAAGLHTSTPALCSSSEEDDDEDIYAYDSIIYPQSSAAVGQLAPDFSAPGAMPLGPSARAAACGMRRGRARHQPRWARDRVAGGAQRPAGSPRAACHA
jgi:hypothetical protein